VKEIRNAMADRLLAMSSVTSQVSTFRGVPAIFSTSPVPPAATGTFIVIRDASSDVPWESKVNDAIPDYVATKGREVSHDVAIYQDQTGDSSVLEDLAKTVRDAFHRYPLTVSGYGTLIAKAFGPITAPMSEEMDNQVDGRLITVELTVIKNP
jgi:hypothetical protein